MSDLALVQDVILPMSFDGIEKVRQLEAEAMNMPQENVETIHTFHAGIYARTVKIPAGVVITGVLVKIPTLLIVSGNVVMFSDKEPRELNGYHVFSAFSGRKQAFVAKSETYLTMLFPTKAETVEEAEAEFTDETHLLVTRRENE